MKEVLVIGIGVGDPDHLTVQAVRALNRVDVFFVMDKGVTKGKLRAVREEILRRTLRDCPTDNVDYRALARRSDRFTGADLKAAVDVAVESRLVEAMRSGRTMPIRTKDVQEQLARRKPSVGEWLATARNYVLYANQGGAYDDLARYLRL